MKKDIENYCQSCPQCQIRKGHGKSNPPLQPLKPITSKFERVSMDVMGPLPTTMMGNKYILVVIDHLTRFVLVFAMQDQKAETIAKIFAEQVVLPFGAPIHLLTDRGTNFVSDLMKQVCKLLSIKQIQTTAYHPQANGATERYNQTLANSLSYYVEQSQRDWDQWIPYVVSAYNSIPHTSTNETPYFLMFGQDYNMPMEDILTPRRIPTNLDDQYHEVVRLRIRLAHEEAVKQLEKHFEKAKKQYDKGTQIPAFQEGDAVYLKIGQTKPGLGRKLAPRWEGPY